MAKSAEALEAMFQKADSDLNYLSRKLEFEIENNTNGESPNPAKMLEVVSEIKKEYSAIAKETQEIQKAQQETMDFFRTQLFSVCQMVQKLGDQTGAEGTNPPDLTELGALLNFDPEQLKSMAPVDKSTNNTASESSTSQVKPPSSNSTEQPSVVGQSDLRASCKDYMDVTEEEFNSVSDLIKGRVKLADVNHTYQVLWQHFKEEKNKKPLTTADMHKMGLKVTGSTGQAKLKVLRSLKLLNLTSKGDVTIT